MARSISIESLGFRNLRKGNNLIQCRHDETKSEKSGDKVSIKNLFVNPENPSIYLFLSFSIYIAMESVSLSQTDFLFIKHRSKLGAGAKIFKDFLEKITQKYEDEVMCHIRPERSGYHGVKKGSSTYATTGAISPPSLISIYLRGEWSIGKVFDIYFKFGEFGDAYLGRILSGLDPNSPYFDILPPHFTVGLENQSIKKAVEVMYGHVILNHPSSAPILKLCLESIVYHSKFMKKIIRNDPGHSLSNLCIFSDDKTLEEFKELVTTKPNEHMNPSSVHAHIRHLKELIDVKIKMIEINDNFMDQSSVVVEAVQKAIQENDIRSGTLNLNTLEVKIFLMCSII